MARWNGLTPEEQAALAGEECEAACAAQGLDVCPSDDILERVGRIVAGGVEHRRAS